MKFRVHKHTCSAEDHSITPVFSVLLYLTIALSLTAYAAPSHAQLSDGDVLVTDISFGASSGGALFRVNPATGVRTVLSDFNNGVQGRIGSNPTGVTLGSPGNVLVIDQGAGTTSSGTLFRVNALTGMRTVVSDFMDGAQGPPGKQPSALTLEVSGNVLVTDEDGGTNSRGALFRVNTVTGARTQLSDFGNSAQGPLAADPSGVTLDASSNVLVIDFNAGTSLRGALFSVNPATGMRTLVSDFGNGVQGPLGLNPRGLTLDASGNLLVIDSNATSDPRFVQGRGVLFRVNPTSGVRSVISDFGNLAFQPLGTEPSGLTVDGSGNILVIDQGSGTTGRGALFRVDPASGARTLVNDFGNAVQGPLGLNPIGVAVVTDSTQMPMPGSLRFSAASYTVDEAGPVATITVTRTSGSTGQVSVAFTTGGGNAIQGADYTLLRVASLSPAATPAPRPSPFPLSTTPT